jgi:hypothetical protein
VYPVCHWEVGEGEELGKGLGVWWYIGRIIKVWIGKYCVRSLGWCSKSGLVFEVWVGVRSLGWCSKSGLESTVFEVWIGVVRNLDCVRNLGMAYNVKRRRDGRVVKAPDLGSKSRNGLSTT